MRRDGRSNQRGRRLSLRIGRGDAFEVGVDKIIDLVVKEIESARYRKDREKRKHDQAGIEVPSPDGAVKIGTGRSFVRSGGSPRRGRSVR
jgi:hypothetical protein